MTTIKVIEKFLTDGSSVFDVSLLQPGACIKLAAVTQNEAIALADCLLDAITNYTNETVKMA